MTRRKRVSAEFKREAPRRADEEGVSTVTVRIVGGEFEDCAQECAPKSADHFAQARRAAVGLTRDFPLTLRRLGHQPLKLVRFSIS
jgi:hypothetical protein